MTFFIVAWEKRRSTRTTTVLACLSLTTTPWSVRFGISNLYFFFVFGLAREAVLGFAAAFGLADLVFFSAVPVLGVAAALISGSGIPRRFCAAMVFMRATSRRMTRTREVFSSCPVARWKRRLNCSFLSLSTSSSIWSSVIALTSCAFMALLGDAFDESGLDRQLGGGERQRFLGDGDRNAVDLEQDAAWLDAANPQLGRALAFAHADFDRLLRHRHVREDADPHPARPLHEAGERAARGLDLARGDALGLQRLEAVLAKRKRRAGGGDAVDAALEAFAELGTRRLQHDLNPDSL